jgi:hypothetical protein
MGQQQIGLIVHQEESLHGMMVDKSNGLTAEETIITWHHLQACKFLEVWMNCILFSMSFGIVLQIK